MKNRILIYSIIVFIISGCSGMKKHKGESFGGGWNMPPEKVTYSAPGEIPVEKVDYATKKQIPTESITHVSKGSKVRPVDKVTNDIAGREIFRDYDKTANSGSSRGGNKSKSRPEKDKGNKDGNLVLLLALAGIGAAAFGSISARKNSFKRLTRFASNNPGKAQAVITVLKVFLLAVGVLGGYNLHKMGYHTDLSLAAVSAGIGLAGFFATPFFSRNSSTILPRILNRRRMVMLGIALAGLTSSAIIGNNLEKIPELSGLKTLVENTDAHITKSIAGACFGDDLSPENLSKARKVNSGGQVFLAILATLGLIILACSGVCLAILGGALIFGGYYDPANIMLGILLIPAGILLAYYSVKWMGDVWANVGD